LGSQGKAFTQREGKILGAKAGKGNQPTYPLKRTMQEKRRKKESASKVANKGNTSRGNKWVINLNMGGTKKRTNIDVKRKKSCTVENCNTHHAKNMVQGCFESPVREKSS